MNTQKLTYLGLPLFVVFSVVWMFQFLPVGKASPATICNVPSGPYPTIQSAVDVPTCDTINVSNGTFIENVSVSRDVTITGQGSVNTIVDGNDTGSVFTIQAGAAVTLTEVSITNGLANQGGGIRNNDGVVTLSNSVLFDNQVSNTGGVGGGIYNSSGTITVSHSAFHDNLATSSSGGAVFNLFGTITFNNSTFTNNSASSGGGIFNYAGTIMLNGSTLANNSASNIGGGIYSQEGTITVNNSTLSGNSATQGGGIVSCSGTMTLNFSTVNNNSATSNGGGIYHGCTSGTMILKNSIVANSPSGGDCAGTAMISQGYNVDSDNTCHLTATGDMPSTNPVLGLLQNNGGSTWTHALLPGSPAINHIPPGTNGCGTTVTTDQRGYIRPSGTGCDVGAYEWIEWSIRLYLPITLKP